MKNHLTKKVVALAVSALALSPIAIGATVLSADSAYAQGKSGEKGGGGASNRGGKAGGEKSAKANRSAGAAGEKRNKGALASELKGLNAMHANENAFKNASPDSQVGKIAAYRDAAVETGAAYDEWIASYNEYVAFEGSYDGPTSSDLQAQIEATDETDEGYQALLDQYAAALAYETELARLKDLSNADAATYEELQAAEEDVLLVASGGATLSPEALAELRATLGLN